MADSSTAPYKVYFHWTNDPRTGKLTAISCDEENLPPEAGWRGSLSTVVADTFSSGARNETQAACLTVNKANTLHLKQGGFLYMDVGCWLNGNQNFGLICGEDAAVCKFDPGLGGAASGGGGGKTLLDQFTQMPGVSVQFRGKTQSPQPADPQRLYLILPDMHVADAPPSGHPRPFDDGSWDRSSFGGLVGGTKVGAWDIDPHTFDAMSEQDLFNSRASIPAMVRFLSLVQGLSWANKITLVQLGDMYELWAGRERCFRPTKPSDPKIYLIPNESRQDGAEAVGSWIGQTHQRYPELFQAFDRCASRGIKMLFLHGNHDDYLSRPEVVGAAAAYIKTQPNSDTANPQGSPASTVYPRQPEVNQDGIFIEHGQRCDWYNRDGATEGYENCNQAVHPHGFTVAHAASLIPGVNLKEFGNTRRGTFVGGAAALWCVKERNFGVYVMGHTHEAQLKQVLVYHQREGVSYVAGPEAMLIKEVTETPLEGTSQ